MPAFELSDLLSAASRAGSGSEERDEPAKTPPGVLCLTLTEVAARYAAPCPFKPGDIITPRRGFHVRRHGEPHIVLEVFESPVRITSIVEEITDVGHPVFGSRLDFRVCCEVGGKITAYTAESWMYEPYTGPRATLD